MIFDSLTSCRQYCSMHKHFAAAFAFLERATREDLPVGRYELEGTALFASVQEYDSKLPEGALFEGHRRYIDLQYVMSGVEYMEASTPSYAEIETDYDSEKDFQLFKDHTAPVACTVHAGEFVIFFPHDIHKPGLCVDRTPAPVKKIVVKIEV